MNAAPWIRSLTVDTGLQTRWLHPAAGLGVMMALSAPSATFRLYR